MPKGKNFTAAEKHYEGIVDRFRKENNLLRNAVTNQVLENQQLIDRIKELEKENFELKQNLASIVKYADMSPEDAKILAKSDAEKANFLKDFSDTMSFMSKFR